MTTDPEKVPAFPVYTLQISEGSQAVTLDGAAVPLADDDDFVAAGIAAIVAKLHRHHLGVVRVRAIDASTDDSWDMIVSATGEVLDLSEQHEAEKLRKERNTKRTKYLLIAGVGTLAVLTLGGVTAAVVVANQPQAQAPAYVPQGVGATLPAAPPPQHAPTAAWSHTVATGSTVNMISAERLLTADPDGSVTARNPETGQPVWRGAGAPENLHAMHQTTWAGQSVYAAVVGQELRLWPTTMPPDAYSVSPTAIALEPGQSARTDVALPYIDLGDWYIRLPDGAGKLHNVMIPPGSTVLNTTADGGITTLSANTIYTLDNNGTITAEKSFAAPEGTTRYPSRVWTLDESHLLLAWDEGTRLMGVLDTTTGKLVATAKPRAIPSVSDDLFVDRDAHTAAIGSIGVSYGSVAALTDLKSASITSIHGTTVYANTNNGPVTMDLTHPEAEMMTWDNYRTEDPAPELVTNDAIYLVATQLENTVVYRSNRTQ
ncbi:hypothetical protein ACFY5D_21085 [Paeniglutamicibacter sp. NPDC012692]|uniref:hypothetical protein n=1 Tax=Paeniglutamicibacter sp. NPDC012692 TaxID=3364388 RepID=UPI00367889AC